MKARKRSPDDGRGRAGRRFPAHWRGIHPSRRSGVVPARETATPLDMRRTQLLLAALAGSACLLIPLRAQTAPVPPAPVAKLTPAEAAAEREKFTQEVQALVAGHEKEAAETVFKNIRVLKGVPAGRIAAIMNLGYGQSLGVSCTHCHTPGEWDKDDKPPKEIAREMGRLAATINNELLPKIANLDSGKPVVNCTTCHRGELKPALKLAPRP